HRGDDGAQLGRCTVSRRRQLCAAEPRADVDGLLGVLRANLGKADAFITTAEDLIERSWGCENDDGDESDDGGDSIMRRRNHVEYLVEAAKMAVRAAAYTGEELEDLARRRTGS